MLFLMFGFHQQSLIGNPLTKNNKAVYSPRIEVTPNSILKDEKIAITLSGFKSGQKITVIAQTGSLSSYGIFRADTFGNVDLTKQSPISGTYEGIDGMGLIWSQTKSAERTSHRKSKVYHGYLFKMRIIGLAKNSRIAAAGLRKDDILISLNGEPVRYQKELYSKIKIHLSAASNAQEDKTFKLKIERDGRTLTLPITVHKDDISTKWYKGVILGSMLTKTTLFEAEVAGKVVASTVLKTFVVAADVTETPVRENGLVGSMFKPDSPGPHPCIIVVGGSGGGLNSASYKSKMLASHGYAAFALAYFAYEDLPRRLVYIPLEYFEKAIQWIETQNYILPQKIGVLGVSRGGELALLLGATFPKIKAVVAYVPGHVVWGYQLSSWTYRGKSLEFVPYNLTSEQRMALFKEPPYELTPMFRIRLKNTAAVEKAAIPVERINGPVLLISGKDDQMWPSAYMSDMVMKRLSKYKHPFPFYHLSYEGAGHIIDIPYYPTTRLHGMHPIAKTDYAYGGNAKDNAFASADSWPKVLQFLNKSLAP